MDVNPMVVTHKLTEYRLAEPMPDITALKALPTAAFQKDGIIASIVSTRAKYQFNAASIEDDDGNHVIIPDDIISPAPGRWIKTNDLQAASDTGNNTIISNTDSIKTAVINAAGTGYVGGDELTVAGGTFTVAAEIRVLTTGGGGEIQIFEIKNAGEYTVDPALIANAVTGGTGAGATFDLTMSPSVTIKIDPNSPQALAVESLRAFLGVPYLRSFQRDSVVSVEGDLHVNPIDDRFYWKGALGWMGAMIQGGNEFLKSLLINNPGVILTLDSNGITAEDLPSPSTTKSVIMTPDGISLTGDARTYKQIPYLANISGGGTDGGVAEGVNFNYWSAYGFLYLQDKRYVIGGGKTPDNYDEGTDLRVTIDGSPDGSGSGDVEFTLEYNIMRPNVGQVIPSTKLIVTDTLAMPGVGDGYVGTTISFNSYELESAIINNAGTGYVASDVLTINGADFSVAATITVDSVGGSGEITSFTVSEKGRYSVVPTLTANAVTGGTGTGATFDLTFPSSIKRGDNILMAIVRYSAAGNDDFMNDFNANSIVIDCLVNEL